MFFLAYTFLWLKGDTVDFRGPNGLIIYKGRGKFAVRPSKAAIPVEHYYRELGMIAGGSGITPILQVCFLHFLLFLK